MTPLVIGAEQLVALHALRRRAEARPIPLGVIATLAPGEGMPGGRNLDFTIEIPLAFTVTFTMEFQPCGLCRHVSMSVAAGGRIPHPVGLDLIIMPELGFERPLDELGRNGLVWVEAVGGGKEAINVVEPVDFAGFLRGRSRPAEVS